MQGLALPAKGQFWLKGKKQSKSCKILGWPLLQWNELSACGYDSSLRLSPKPWLPGLRQHFTMGVAASSMISHSSMDAPACLWVFRCKIWVPLPFVSYGYRAMVLRKSSLPSPVCITGSMRLIWDNTKGSLLSDVFEVHFATSVPFTDEGWQSQKCESTHLRKMDKALWYEHPSQKSFWSSSPCSILTSHLPQCPSTLPPCCLPCLMPHYSDTYNNINRTRCFHHCLFSFLKTHGFCFW